MCTPSRTGTAQANVLIENKRTRTTQWRFPKRGDNTGWHSHACDDIVVPLFDGQLEILDAEGNRTLADMKTGVPIFAISASSTM